MGLSFSHQHVVTGEETPKRVSMEESRASRVESARQLKARFLLALQEDDAQEVKRILRTTSIDIDTVLEVEDRDKVLASYKQGYWLPDYKLESSWAMGIHVCMMYNSLACASVLLESGAAMNGTPNGKTPLHVACAVSHGDCVALLLNHGARVNRLSLSGHAALHYCITSQSVECAQHLILKGADVNMASQSSDEDTPLLTAARFGVPALAALYLTNGADVNVSNSRFETPLITATYWAFCTREQTLNPDHHLVCRILLDHGAALEMREDDCKTALHKAAWNADHVMIEMLLAAGADSQAMDMNGCSPIQYLLKVTPVRPASLPELCYQLMLNHGGARVYPPQFHKVLQACHGFPRAVEVMVNSYERIKATKKWKTSIADESYQQHKEFYDSMFAVCSNKPRSLMHLARCAIRAKMLWRCHKGAHELPIPPSMVRYILLEPEGIIY